MNEHTEYFKQGDESNLKLFLERYGQGIAEEIKNNPAFMPCLKQSIRELLSSQVLPGESGPISIRISEDGKEVTLRSKIRKSPIQINTELQDNISFDQVKFSLKGDKLHVTSSSGIMYNYDDLKKYNSSNGLNQSIGTGSFHSVVDTFHTNRIFTSDGIQLTYATFSDTAPATDVKDERNLISQTLDVHAPKSWGVDGPILPAAKFNAKTSAARRSIDNLGMVTLTEAKNIDSKGDSSDIQVKYCESLTEWPELLGYIPTDPIATNERGNIVLSENAQKRFPNMNFSDVQREVSKEFVEGLDHSKTREYSPLLYDKMREMSTLSLNKQYGIEVPEVSESQGMKM